MLSRQYGSFDHPPPAAPLVADALVGVAEEVGRSPAQVALRWVMQRPGVTCPVIGAKRMDQLADNIAATTFKLSEAQMEALNKGAFKGFVLSALHPCS